MNILSFFILSSCVIAFLGVTLIHAAPATQYCATVLPGEASGASGYVALQIANGEAYYGFSLNLNNFQTSSCPSVTTSPIKYHVHVSWSNTTAASTANGLCSTAGGHYDPNFACSNYSSAIGTSCLQLGRTWGQGYRYACNTTQYNSGHYSLCEIGDTSAKHGTLTPVDGILTLPLFTDYQPPYAVNWNLADLDSTMWLSFVFHCAANAQRLVCASFSTTDLSACSAAFAAFPSSNAPSFSPAYTPASTDSNDDDKVPQADANAAIIISCVVCTFGGLLIGFLFTKFLLPKCSGGGASAPLLK
jgi:hypothetical protein